MRNFEVMFFALILGFIAGALFIVTLNIIAVWYWLRLQPKEHPKLVPEYSKVKHAKDLSDYCKTEGAAPSESCVFLNLMISFLWREWRDAASTRRFFIKKLNLEFQELLLNKAAGKLLQQIQVKDYFLGDSLPTIKKATVMKIQSRNPDETAKELDLALEIEYSGGFLISLDVDLIFGKTAYLAVKLNSLRGRLRLQFTRVPCTHWSFSFYEDPEMDIQVESQFNGRTLAQLTTLIKKQIRKSVKRKHTLPMYKVRYKPFFRQPIPQDGKQDVFIHNSLITVGKLSVEVMECSRLPSLPPNSHLYCIVSVDPLPWKEDMPTKSSLWPVHEIVLSKALSGSIGISIKSSLSPGNYEFQKEMIVVDTISPQSPASLVDIKRGDILLSVNDVDVESFKQAIRLLKNGGERFVLKLQRPSSVPSAESQEVSDADLEKDEETMRQSNNAMEEDVENPFNITMCDEDSDGDDFVNIVVKELEEQIAENDVKARKILRKVSLSTRKGKNSKGNSVNFKADEDDPVKNDSVVAADVGKSETTKDSGIEDTRKTSSSSSEQGMHAAEKEGKVQGNERGNEMDVGESGHGMEAENVPTSLRQRSTSLKRKVFGVTEKKFEEKREGSDREFNRETEHGVKARKHNSLRRQILHRSDKSIDIDSDSSDSQSLKSLELDGDGDWDNISQHTLFSKDGTVQQNVQKTSAVFSNVDPVWNESFTFDVEKQHKFMNICIWSKSDERPGKEFLIGYCSVSLMEIGLECLSTTSGKLTQSYILTLPYSRAGVSRTSLRVLMPGLKSEACNGDVTLSFCYKPSLSDCTLPEEALKDDVDGGNDEKFVKDKGPLISSGENEDVDVQQSHDFIATQFYFPTRCDYCQKKVWTKTALQCRVCTMISHKKCISNAHSNTYCTRLGVRAKPPAWRSGDDASTRPKANSVKERKEEKYQRLQDGKTQAATEQRKLATDNKNARMKEPKATIHHSHSTVGEWGKIGADTNKDSKLSEDPSLNSRPFRSESSPLLVRRNSDSLREPSSREHPLQRSFESEDRLDSIANVTVTAQQAGKELFSSSKADDDHMEIFRSKVKKLQVEIDDENQTQAEISSALKRIGDSERRSKLQISLRKSEERKQALVLLMIQYETALRESCVISDVVDGQ